MNTRTVRAFWLGLRAYEPIHVLQQHAMAARQQRRIGDTLLLLEHSPVITLGRGAKEKHLLLSREAILAQGVDLVNTARGGDVTYHGPGQLVGYPIIDLAPDRCDVRRYVQDLLATMMGLASEHGVEAGVIDRYPGIWVDLSKPQQWTGQEQAARAAKLGAVGVRIERWTTMHGFALNACTNLDNFRLIVPCGIQEYEVTSLNQLCDTSPTPQAMAQRAALLFCKRIQASLSSFEYVDAPDEELPQAIGIGDDSQTAGTTGG